MFNLCGKLASIVIHIGIGVMNDRPGSFNVALM